MNPALTAALTAFLAVANLAFAIRAARSNHGRDAAMHAFLAGALTSFSLLDLVALA